MEEKNSAYTFEFLTEAQAKSPSNGEIWFRVRDVFEMKDPYAVITYISQNNLAGNQGAVEKLSRLQKIVHTDPVISFYQEKDQEIEKVLNIFIRTNSGGTVLSYSDLLLSIASSQWQDRDARQEIRNLVEDINGTRLGFNFSKDFVLKAGLMIADIGSVGFKVTNFNRSNMQVLEQGWDRISDALKITAELVGSFGISRDNLRADSALLPIAYYVAMRGFDWSFINSTVYAEDRIVIKSWLIRSLIKPGIWGSGLDVLLTDLRKIIITHGSTGFPTAEIETAMRRKGKSLSFADEEIEALLDLKYGHRELFGLLTLLFPFVDTSTNHFHIDHVFPKSAFHTSALRRVGMNDDEIADAQTKKDQLPNLQLLPGIPNQEKSSTMPLEWLKQHIKDVVAQQDYISRHSLEDIADDITQFSIFFDRRRKWLAQRLGAVLSKMPSET